MHISEQDTGVNFDSRFWIEIEKLKLIDPPNNLHNVSFSDADSE